MKKIFLAVFMFLAVVLNVKGYTNDDTLIDYQNRDNDQIIEDISIENNESKVSELYVFHEKKGNFEYPINITIYDIDFNKIKDIKSLSQEEIDLEYGKYIIRDNNRNSYEKININEHNDYIINNTIIGLISDSKIDNILINNEIVNYTNNNEYYIFDKEIEINELKYKYEGKEYTDNLSNSNNYLKISNLGFIYKIEIPNDITNNVVEDNNDDNNNTQNVDNNLLDYSLLSVRESDYRIHNYDNLIELEPNTNYTFSTNCDRLSNKTDSIATMMCSGKGTIILYDKSTYDSTNTSNDFIYANPDNPLHNRYNLMSSDPEYYGSLFNFKTDNNHTLMYFGIIPSGNYVPKFYKPRVEDLKEHNIELIIKKIENNSLNNNTLHGQTNSSNNNLEQETIIINVPDTNIEQYINNYLYIINDKKNTFSTNYYSYFLII